MFVVNLVIFKLMVRLWIYQLLCDRGYIKVAFALKRNSCVP